MNFKFTPKRTAIFVAGLIAAGTIGAALNNEALGLGILVMVVMYIAKDT